jgi:uncharacterized protein with FMN-binding domain
MRRGALAILGTIAGTSLLIVTKLGTHPATDPSTVPLSDSAVVPPAGNPSEAGDAPPAAAPAPGPVPSVPGKTTAPAPTPTKPAGGPKNGTFTGAGAAARHYETVTVTITVSGGRMTVVSGSCGAASGESRSICTRAMPKLQQEALTAQNANVATVSGATYTSQAYKSSLQSALDQAKA